MPENVSEAVKKPLKRLAEIWQRHKVVLSCLCLFGLVLWAFWPSLNCQFLFHDESAEIINEPHVNGGLSLKNIIWAITSFDHCSWNPVKWLSHMLDCEFYGLDAWGHHLTGILIHAFNSVLVFLALRMMTGAFWRSLAVAIVFGLHPLRVESVTWICERKDVLSLFFWMLTLLAYTKYAQESTSQNGKVTKFYCLSLLFFVFGLMSKAMLVTMPFVLLLLDYWPLNRWQKISKRRLILEKLPFLGIAGIVSWLVFTAQKLGGMTDEMQGLTFNDKVGNALISYVRYMGKFFWPENLSIYYPHPGHWPWPYVLAAGGTVLIASIVVFLQRSRRPYLMVGWFWFLGTMVPVIGLVQLLSQAMANRYTYIPMIGFALMLVWLVVEFATRLRYQLLILPVLFVSLVCFWIIRVRLEIPYFKDDVTLYSRAVWITRDENNWSPHYELGTMLLAASQQDNAFNEFQESVRLNPDYAPAQLSLGVLLARQGRTDEALAHYQKALALRPNWDMAWYNCGTIYFVKGHINEALKNFEKSIDFGLVAKGQAYVNLIHKIRAQAKESNDNLRSAIKTNPDRFDLLNNLAWLLASNPDDEIRNGNEAVQLAKRACELTDFQITACVGTLAAAYAEAGDFDQAVKMSKLACSMAEKKGDNILLQKNRMMLQVFDKRAPYYEMPPEIQNELNGADF